MSPFARLFASCLLLVAAAAGPAAAQAPFSPAQSDAIRDLVREYIRDNPEVIIEALKA